MSYPVQITAGAERELRAILQWLTERSRPGAESWAARWSQVLEELAESPESFGPAPEDEDHEETIRQAIFKTRRGLPYRALFIVRETTVYVLHVRGPGQDVVPPDELHSSD